MRAGRELSDCSSLYFFNDVNKLKEPVPSSFTKLAARCNCEVVGIEGLSYPEDTEDFLDDGIDRFTRNAGAIGDIDLRFSATTRLGLASVSDFADRGRCPKASDGESDEIEDCESL